VEQEREIARFFDCCETPGQRKMNTRISHRARRELVKGIRELGLDGKSVLEVGCGPGDLTRELIRAGARQAIGIDLAEETIKEARSRASEEGVSDRITFRVGNGAKEHLEPHDVVVLDKVICCYPDWRELVDNTSQASSVSYGFVIPRSEGLTAPIVRFFVAVQSLALKLRKCGFRPFVHDFRKIHRHLSDQGFRRTLLSKGPVWMTAVYARS
jgi:SAM-dependent methyltransferase